MRRSRVKGISDCIYGVCTIVIYDGYVCKGIKLDKGVSV